MILKLSGFKGGKMSKVVVLGGSFNPPTIAHEKLLSIAVDTLKANIGLFVPSSHNYVARKMRKQNKEKQTLPESVRVKMLEEMCSTNRKFKVDTCEIGDDGRDHTYDTLSKIQRQFPNEEVYFIIGYDTIKMLPKWHSKESLVANFKFVVFSRNGLDTQREIDRYPLLVKYRKNFISAVSPDDIKDISSTAIRENITKNKDLVKQMMNPRAYEILLDNCSYFE